MGNEVSMDEIFQFIQENADQISPSQNLPKLENQHYFPEDMKKFYAIFGSILLFPNSKFPIRIYAPDEFKIANTEMFQYAPEDEISKTIGHISWNWYIFAEVETEQEYKFVIDLSKQGNGNCYNCYWVTYPGEIIKIASSFTDFLRLILNSDPNELSWYPY
jgi:SMI1 / KNR4 family (SUKH-1)